MNMWRRGGWVVLLAVVVSFTVSLLAMVVVPAEFNEMVTASLMSGRTKLPDGRRSRAWSQSRSSTRSKVGPEPRPISSCQADRWAVTVG